MSTDRASHPKRHPEPRLEVIDPLGAEGRAQLLAFFRQLDAPHVYWEFIYPSARQATSLTLAAVVDRPWPPWGIGAFQIRALIYLHPLGERLAGVGGLFMRPDEVGNVGMACALYKEGLEEAARQGAQEVGYLVREDSHLVDRALRATGFERREERVVTHDARYGLAGGDLSVVLRNLGLAGRSERDLFALDLDDASIDRFALFHLSLHVGLLPWLRDPASPGELWPVLAGAQAGYEPGTP